MSSAAIAIPAGSITSPIHLFRGNLKPQTNPHTAPTVFVVDEDVRVQRSLEQLISSQGWQPETCDSSREFFARPRAVVPSALILAFSTNSNGLETQKRIAREYAETPIVVVADYEDIPTAVQAIKAGAIDFLVKPIIDEMLLPAIRHGLARSHAALNRWKEMHDLRQCYGSLSPREQQVMALVVSGLLNKQVGAELGISEITVKAHRGQVMQKMKATSFAHLVNIGAKLRITSTVISNVA
jgi:FixJ family two-component response regulator